MQADTEMQNTYDPQTLNRYSYVHNNPLKYTDPTGKVVWYGGGTFSVGAILGGQLSFGIAVSVDSSSLLSSPSISGIFNTVSSLNIGVYGKGGAGISTPTGSFNLEGGVAPLQQNIDEFEGNTFDFGVDFGEFVTVGLGVSVPRKDKEFGDKDKSAIDITIAPFTDFNYPPIGSAYASKSKTMVIHLFGRSPKATNQQINTDSMQSSTTGPSSMPSTSPSSDGNNNSQKSASMTDSKNGNINSKSTDPRGGSGGQKWSSKYSWLPCG